MIIFIVPGGLLGVGTVVIVGIVVVGAHVTTETTAEDVTGVLVGLLVWVFALDSLRDVRLRKRAFLRSLK